ncbi:hypothetical protein DITRI_Ditri13aG0107100 [Diplodiscus trichospermus]
MFLWLAIQNKLLTKEELHRRHLVGNPLCNCNQESESLMHVLRDCIITKQTWYELIPVQYRQKFFSLNLQDWIFGNLRNEIDIPCEENWRCVFGVAIWKFWSWRNQAIFNGRKISHSSRSQEILCKAKEIQHVNNLQNNFLLGRKQQVLVSWKPPAGEFVKLNTDGAWDKINNIASAGGVIRNSHGDWVFGFAMNIGPCGITDAELWGIHQGLILAWERGFRKVEVETDCLTALQAIQNKEKRSNFQVALASSIRELIDRDWQVVLSHNFRQTNHVADYLAKLARKLHQGIAICEEPPVEIRQCLQNDSNNVEYSRLVRLLVLLRQSEAFSRTPAFSLCIFLAFSIKIFDYSTATLVQGWESRCRKSNMDVGAFPGPSLINLDCYGMFQITSDDEDSQGEASASQEGNIPSANKDNAVVDSSVEFTISQISDYQKLQCVNNYCKAAYLEVMRMAKEACTWIHALPTLGNLDDIVSEFRTPALPGKKLEFSVATAVIPNISAVEMANMMLKVNKNWSKLLFPFVNHGEVDKSDRILQHLNNIDTAINGVTQVYAELQLPTTFLPTRYFLFLRYGREITNGAYIVVDISSGYFGDGFAEHYSRKRPSGIIIRERGSQDCEIIRIENVEVAEIRENWYSSFTDSNLAFCANRWINTLLWNLRRQRSTFIDVKIDVHRRAGSYLLALTRSMHHFFMDCVSEHPDDALFSVLTRHEDPIRLLRNKKANECTVYVGLTSFSVQAKPLLVFKFLMKKDLKLEFRSSANAETNEEIEQLFQFTTDDKSNIISLHRKNMEEETRYCLQEASSDEYCSFILSKLMREDAINLHIVSGEKNIDVESKRKMYDIYTSGFSIMPDGSGGLECNGSLVTFLMQLQYDLRKDPVTLDTVRNDFLNDLFDVIMELEEEVVLQFPGPSRVKLHRYVKSLDDQDSQEPSENEGKAIAGSSVELKTYKRRSSGHKRLQCAITSANEGRPVADSSVELKTYKRRSGSHKRVQCARTSANEGRPVAGSSVELRTYKRKITDYQKLQRVNNYCKAAYLEVVRKAKEACTWIRALPPLGNLDDIVSEFRTPALHGKKLEFSVAMAVIPNISAMKMANMMLKVNKKWSKLLFPFVNYGEGYKPNRILQHLSNTDNAIRVVEQVYAELQLPTTFVPTRYFDFLRYGKETRDGAYIVVDISSRYFGDGLVKSNSEKRPSGVIIRECGPQECEIICIENVEVDETRENMYSSFINSNLAFCANRWISTLLWNLRRERSAFIDVKMDVHKRAGSYLLALTRSMHHFFMECVSRHPDEVLLSVLTSGEDQIRLLHNKTLEDCAGYVSLTSFRVQAKPLSVFKFLMKKDLKLEFRSTANSETDEEFEQLFQFTTDDKSNTISLHGKNMEEETRYCLQEASRDEYCSFILSKLMTEDVVNLHIVSGEKSIHKESEERICDITTTGFSIMPDGSGGMECNGSLVTFLMQLQYDPTKSPVMLDTVRDDFLGDLNDIIRELNEEDASRPFTLEQSTGFDVKNNSIITSIKFADSDTKKEKKKLKTAVERPLIAPMNRVPFVL